MVGCRRRYIGISVQVKANGRRPLSGDAAGSARRVRAESTLRMLVYVQKKRTRPP